MGTKILALRRAGFCSRCSIELPAGTRAEWNSTAKAVSCLECACADTVLSESPDLEPIQTREAAAATAPSATEPEVEPGPIDTGEAGVSARKEHQRRHAKREAQIEQKWGTGRMGRIAKALSDDPQTTKAWETGAVGEERVAKVLQHRLGDAAVLLHDRKVPSTRGNIDHLAIAASGVWIIDAKRYGGKVERRDVGGFFRTDLRLFVGGRDRNKLIGGMQWQFEAVVAALDGADIPVHRALSFVDAEWPLFFAKPLQFEGVWVSWPKKLAELIAEPGPVDESTVEATARLLADRLPANR